ncbi:MAG: acetyl-CoA C-acetyltransferase [Georgfuchsia sp.]
MNEAYIVAAVRTAAGRRGGRLKDWHPVDLAASVINALLDRSKADPAMIDDVIMGCVGQVGEQSTNVGRNAVIASRLPETVPGTSVDRQCGSSQQALHFAAQAVMSGTMDVVIAAGVESMSRVPMGLSQTLPKANGYGRYMSPRMQVRYPEVVFNQFQSAEGIGRKHNLTKEDFDQFGLESQMKAATATKNGWFEAEILPLEITLPDGSRDMHKIDEGIRFDVSLEAIRNVKPIVEGGTLTAATSSQMSDAAAGLMVVNERGLKMLGVKPLARVHHMSVMGGDPVVMLDVPLAATNRALARAGMKIGDIDLYEVNEAFAPIPIAWLRHTGADPSKLNVHGGAIALGHPLGSSGAKLMTTLIHALQRNGKRFGLQTMCEGGGLANVTIIERL